MPSPTRSSSSRKKSAATRIQKKFRSNQTKKKQKEMYALKRIENKVRSIKIKNYEKERSRRHEEEVAKFRNISTQRNKRKEVARKFRARIKIIINNKEKENECAICLDKMMLNTNVTPLECGHRFHTECIHRSLRSNKATCPLCRSIIRNNANITHEQGVISRDQALEELRLATRALTNARSRTNNYERSNRTRRLRGVNSPTYIRLLRTEEEASEELTRARERVTNSMIIIRNLAN